MPLRKKTKKYLSLLIIDKSCVAKLKEEKGRPQNKSITKLGQQLEIAFFLSC